MKLMLLMFVTTGYLFASQTYQFDEETQSCVDKQGQPGRNKSFIGVCGDPSGTPVWFRASSSNRSFQGIKIDGLDLSKANFKSADFRGASMRGTNLTEANFSNADLRGADLTDANLRGAIFNSDTQLPFSIEAAKKRKMVLVQEAKILDEPKAKKFTVLKVIESNGKSLTVDLDDGSDVPKSITVATAKGTGIAKYSSKNSVCKNLCEESEDTCHVEGIYTFNEKADLSFMTGASLALPGVRRLEAIQPIKFKQSKESPVLKKYLTKDWFIPQVEFSTCKSKHSSEFHVLKCTGATLIYKGRDLVATKTPEYSSDLLQLKFSFVIDGQKYYAIDTEAKGYYRQIALLTEDGGQWIIIYARRTVPLMC